MSIIKKIQIIAIVGKAGSGKDTILREYLKRNESCKNNKNRYTVLNKVIPVTTRPPRPKEKDKVDYYFVNKIRYNYDKLKGMIIADSSFRDWHYFYRKACFKSDVINIGIFNLQALEEIKKYFSNSVVIHIIYISADDKLRLSRQLNREDTPDCKEICRRFLADDVDFKDIKGLYEYKINNNDGLSHSVDNLESIIKSIKQSI